MAQPARVAVIGSGPAGVYSAAALLDSDTPVSVDVFDRLPTPYGLVRYGVAPDHIKIKSIANTLERTLAEDRVRFLGNVGYGRDLTLADVRQHYDATIFATGAERARELGIPGEDLPGSMSATEFVAWYNGHPDLPPDPPLAPETRAVAVIGAGNVAIDVARILARDREELTGTDIPDHVLAALKDTSVRDIYLFARRGPEDAKYTPVELRALGELAGVDVVVDGDDLPPAPPGDPPKRPRDNVSILRSWVDRPAEGGRRIHFRYFHRPAEILGDDQVTGLRCDGSRGNTCEPVAVQAVIRAVGYRAQPLADLPFDTESATVRNEDGRVIDDAGATVPGLYVAGWIKRGPTGVIGTNRSDAAATVANVLTDLPHLQRPSRPDPAAVTTLLDERGVCYVTWEGWKRLDAYEVQLGEQAGRARGKVTSAERLLAIADGHLERR